MCFCNQWKISVVEPKEENIFTIVLHKGGPTPGESWSLRDKFPVPHGYIFTSEEISEWRITRADNGLPSSHPVISYVICRGVYGTCLIMIL